MLNSSSDNLTLDCPIYTNFSEILIDQVQFWVEGVTQTCVAVPGFIGNVMFCFILTRKELRNAFNLLLVALACFDSCYIIGAVLESIRTSFELATNIHIMLFPYVLYPGQTIALTGSIFMIVAIAFERYIAVHNPLDYKQAMNDAGAIRRRLCKYLLPVLIASIIFNLPKFFEATFVTRIIQNPNGENVTKVYLNVTEMRMHTAYSTYANWSQSLVLGFLPTLLLVYFNTKIYLDVRERERRKRPLKFQRPVPMNQPPTIQKANGDNGVSVLTSREVQPISISNVAAISRDDVTVQIFSAENDEEVDDNGRQETSKLKKGLSPRKMKTTCSILSLNTAASTGSLTQTAAVTSTPSPAPPPVHSNSNAKRRKAEDKMAMIFVAIVTGFLVTNLPRILLDLHELLVFETAVACTKARHQSFPVWSRVLNSFSHLLLVVNSSMNIIFYGVFNQQFRQMAKKLFVENLNFCKRSNDTSFRNNQNVNKRPIVAKKSNGKKFGAETAV